MKLLIVDDLEQVGAIVGRIAQQLGWDSIHLMSPKGLRQVVARERVDLLMIDYVFDERATNARTGLDEVLDLRKAGCRVPVILFTGWPELVDPTALAGAGILQVLAKPLSIQELRTALNDAKKLHEAPAGE